MPANFVYDCFSSSMIPTISVLSTRLGTLLYIFLIFLPTLVVVGCARFRFSKEEAKVDEVKSHKESKSHNSETTPAKSTPDPPSNLVKRKHEPKALEHKPEGNGAQLVRPADKENDRKLSKSLLQPPPLYENRMPLRKDLPPTPALPKPKKAKKKTKKFPWDSKKLYRLQDLPTIPVAHEPDKLLKNKKKLSRQEDLPPTPASLKPKRSTAIRYSSEPQRLRTLVLTAIPLDGQEGRSPVADGGENSQRSEKIRPSVELVENNDASLANDMKELLPVNDDSMAKHGVAFVRSVKTTTRKPAKTKSLGGVLPVPGLEDGSPPP